MNWSYIELLSMGHIGIQKLWNLENPENLIFFFNIEKLTYHSSTYQKLSHHMFTKWNIHVLTKGTKKWSHWNRKIGDPGHFRQERSDKPKLRENCDLLSIHLSLESFAMLNRPTNTILPCWTVVLKRRLE